VPNIKDRKVFAERLWDWEFLNDCWEGRIRPTDIDGVVERNGYFLFLEGKPLRGKLGDGQKILFKMLTKEFKKSSVFILYGEPGYPKEYQQIIGGKILNKKSCNTKEIKRIFSTWFKAVNEDRGN
jgi:hypothetical protein